MNPAWNDPDQLYKLLPVIHRLRDAEQGDALQALLRIINESADVLEEDITQMYANWFIETCQDWVVPYIGALVGYTPVPDAGEVVDPADPHSQELGRVLTPRREVANTIRYRRRKGTVSLLETLANDIAGWPARVVEFFRLLAVAQPPGLLNPYRGQAMDLRRGDALDRLGGAFNEFAHNLDVRRSGADPSGRFNPAGVGVYIWRLRAYSVTRTAARNLEEVGAHCFTFSALGNNTPLFQPGERETNPVQIAGPGNVPERIRRRTFEGRMIINGVDSPRACTDLYGAGKSVAVYAPDWPVKNAQQPVPAELVIPADLTDWIYRPKLNTLALDPVLGRIAFPPRQLPPRGAAVSYHYGFAADIGGGEYPRPRRCPPEAVVYPIRASGGAGFYAGLNAAFDAWQHDAPDEAVIEFTESGVFTDRFGLQDPEGPPGRRIPIDLKPGQSLEIRAADGARPILRLLDYQSDSPDALSFYLAPGSRLALDGLLITGRPVHLEGLPLQPELQSPETEAVESYLSQTAVEQANAETSQEALNQQLPKSKNTMVPPDRPAGVSIRHCTLVPGWSIDAECEPRRPSEPSLIIVNLNARVEIGRSILGSIQVLQDEVQSDPLPLMISDSVLDATGSECDDPECEALGAPGSALAHATLTILRSTVFGHLLAHAVELGENSIFNGLMRVARRGRGCLRFCYVTPGSRTPRRFNCQPDLVEAMIAEVYPPGPERDRALEVEQSRVRPRFRSMRYGTPDYARLSDACALEIRRGAQDEGEMGVYHHLHDPQREANLRTRLEEYTPAGSDVGIFFVT